MIDVESRPDLDAELSQLIDGEGHRFSVCQVDEDNGNHAAVTEFQMRVGGAITFVFVLAKPHRRAVWTICLRHGEEHRHSFGPDALTRWRPVVTSWLRLREDLTFERITKQVRFRRPKHSCS